jgi:large subunit ribosomal protein L17
MRKFGRKIDNRTQMLKNLTTSVILYEKIKTTAPKAKETRSLVDRVITIAKKDTLSARRELLGFLLDENAVKKVYEVLIPRYKNRHSGYTRILNLGNRVGDGAKKVLIELMDAKKEVKSSESKENDKETSKKNKDVEVSVKSKK